ncbi:MAG TPA: tetratricopeptide repeat protein [Streptosporangiaceae bacterium]|nr:tetratricopeptide repeat protein [Streptosporangiaceae bacterium]
MDHHRWLIGSHLAGHDDATMEVSCHRLLRGPYTGLGAVLRGLVPEVSRRDPALVHRHSTEILAVAPDLAGIVGEAQGTLTSLAPYKEQTRLYPAARTRRIANGVVDFLLACAAPGQLGPLTLSFTRVDHADHTDQEFLAILVRRARPGQVKVSVSTDSGEVPAELAAALDRYARQVRLPELAPAVRPGRDREALARAFVEADGTSSDPAEIAAYTETEPRERAALHDARAAALRRQGEWSLRLGAIPYHAEHGSDPAQAGGAALCEALLHCFSLGFHHAVVDYGRRGRAVTDPAAQDEQYWVLSSKAATSLAALGRPDEAESIMKQLRSQSTRHDIHLVTSYSLAMMYTRHFPRERRNHHLAKEYATNAIAIASLWPDLAERPFHVVFNENGLALIELHLGNLPEAIRLVTRGRERLDRELAPGTYLLHRSVLTHNRATVLAIAGRLDEALADFDRVIEMDPSYAEYYLDRATVKRRLGDAEGAMADYDAAITSMFGVWELHYNRGDLRAEQGDIEGAIADFERVLELEPDRLDARVNAVDLLIEAGRLAEAGAHVAEGLLRAPGDGQLLCGRGRLAIEAGDTTSALADFDRALAADGSLVAALAGRATLAYEAGDLDAAAQDLSRAIEVSRDPDLLYNRGRVHAQARRWQAAIDDFGAALLLPGADQEELLARQAACHAELGQALAS